METMAHNTAVFAPMDPREAASATGAPRSDAIFRTSHRLNPYTVTHYMWNNTKAYQDSLYTQSLFPIVLGHYASEKRKIAPLEVINITAIAAEKGSDHYYECGAPYSKGANILSETFHPSTMTVYVAWENGVGDDWVPAACNSYVAVDLSQFFSTSSEE